MKQMLQLETQGSEGKDRWRICFSFGERTCHENVHEKAPLALRLQHEFCLVTVGTIFLPILASQPLEQWNYDLDLSVIISFAGALLHFRSLNKISQLEGPEANIVSKSIGKIKSEMRRDMGGVQGVY